MGSDLKVMMGGLIRLWAFECVPTRTQIPRAYRIANVCMDHDKQAEMAMP
jgi:hypothetical protein